MVFLAGYDNALGLDYSSLGRIWGEPGRDAPGAPSIASNGGFFVVAGRKLVSNGNQAEYAVWTSNRTASTWQQTYTVGRADDPTHSGDQSTEGYRTLGETRSAAYGGGVWVVTTDAAYLRSTNGSDWSLVTSAPWMPATLSIGDWGRNGTTILFVDGRWFAGAHDGLYVSTDAQTWGHCAPGDWRRAEIHRLPGGRYVGGLGAVWSSPDGAAWSQVLPMSGGSGLWPIHFAVAQGRVIVHDRVGHIPHISSDGVSWSPLVGPWGAVGWAATPPGGVQIWAQPEGFVARHTYRPSGATKDLYSMYVSSDGGGWSQVWTSVSGGAGLTLFAGPPQGDFQGGGYLPPRPVYHPNSHVQDLRMPEYGKDARFLVSPLDGAGGGGLYYSTGLGAWAQTQIRPQVPGVFAPSTPEQYELSQRLVQVKFTHVHGQPTSNIPHTIQPGVGAGRTNFHQGGRHGL